MNITSTLLAISISATGATGAEPTASESTTTETEAFDAKNADWSFGLGAVFGRSGFGPTLSIGGGGAGPVVPVYAASLERRVFDDLWVRAGGSLALYSYGDSNETHGGGGYAGLRYAVWRGGPLTLSGLLTAGVDLRFGRGQQYAVGGDDRVLSTETKWVQYGGALGAAVDVDITQRLQLRLAADLVTARYDQYDIEYEGEPDLGISDTSFALGAGVQPTVELRVVF